MVFAMAFALMGGLALAVTAETPHGPFDSNTQLCAACHRAHTALSEYLVAKTEVTTLCEACHAGGYGADCDVVNGVYVNNGTFTNRTTIAVVTTASANITVATGAGVKFTAGDAIIIDPDGTADTKTVVSVAGDVVTLDSNVAAGITVGTFVGNITTSSPDHANWGTATKNLMGGGFLAINGAPTTSMHFTASAAGDTYWKIQFGGAAGTAAPGASVTALDCVSCHLPHRSSNYRMLRQKPAGYAGDALKVADNFARDGDGAITTSHQYTDDTGRFNLAKTASGNDGISKWCGACHDYYYANSDHNSSDNAPAAGVGYKAGGYYSLNGVAPVAGDKVYMHAIDVDLYYTPRNGSTSQMDLSANLGDTRVNHDKLPVAAATIATGYNSADELNCLTCHRSHGSTAQMTNNARLGVKTRLGLTGAASENMADSTLLRLDNRGVCETCHKMPAGY